MATAIGVLCARVRVEEKQILAAFERAGVIAVPVPPDAVPLPPGPSLHDVQHMVAGIDGVGDAVPLVMLDRISNRAIGRNLNRLLRQGGVTLIDAGVASRRNRLQVASVWARAGVPRPKSLVAFSEKESVQAANSLGYPCTLLPMSHGSAPVCLPDADTADAVIEHRVVLGTDEEEIVMIQQGGLTPETPAFRLHVAGFEAVAADGEVIPPAEVCEVAVAAARAIDGGSIAIDVALIAGEWVAWDAVPLADFRKATALGDIAYADAVVNHAIAKLQIRESEVRDVVLAV